jgi:outer membrane biosynthesis protein TonB
MSTLAVQQERDRRTGVIATILFHILLTILFLFFGLQQPDPLPREEGIEIAMADFGTSMTGSGNVETPTPGQRQASAAPVPETQSTPEEVATDELSEVVVVKPEKPVKPKPETTPKPKPEPEKPKEPTIDNRLAEALNTWGQDGGGGGQGETSTPGNEGIPTGTPGGVMSTMSGEGWSISLGGRGLVKGPNITDRPNIERRSIVVITIKVDRDGKVTDARDNLSKSNTTSQVLFNIAKKAARQASFTTKPDGPYEQQGEMTFIFDPQ